MAHDLRADLDEFLLQARQRPVLDRLGRRQCSQEITEVVGESMQLKPHGIGGERPARQPRPPDGSLAFLDPLLRRPALVVKGDNVLGRSRHVVTMKPTRG